MNRELGDEIDPFLAGADPSSMAKLGLEIDSLAVAFAHGVPPRTPPPTIRSTLLMQIRAEQASPLVTLLAAEATWEELPFPGLQRRVLFKDHANNRITFLLRANAGATIPPHRHGGPEEFLLLEGDLHTGDKILHVGDYQRSAGDTDHAVQWTEHGCVALLIAPLADHG